MHREVLEQNNQNILPKGFADNEALLSRALSPFKDWKAFSRQSREDIYEAYQTLVYAVLKSFGVEKEIEFEVKRSIHYYGIFLKPSTIVLNEFLIKIKHSVHTIIHECAHAYVHSIRNREIPFTDSALYNNLSSNYQRFANAHGFHLQPEEIYADLVAYQLLKKHGFPEDYSIQKKAPLLKIKSTPAKVTLTIVEFIMTVSLVYFLPLMLLFSNIPSITKLILFCTFLCMFVGMPRRMFWLEDCLKGVSRKKFITKRFEQLNELWDG